MRRIEANLFETADEVREQIVRRAKIADALLSRMTGTPRLYKDDEPTRPASPPALSGGAELVLRMTVTEAERALGAGRRLEAIEFLRDARTLLRREGRLSFQDLRARVRHAWKAARG